MGPGSSGASTSREKCDYKLFFLTFISEAKRYRSGGGGKGPIPSLVWGAYVVVNPSLLRYAAMGPTSSPQHDMQTDGKR